MTAVNLIRRTPGHYRNKTKFKAGGTRHISLTTQSLLASVLNRRWRVDKQPALQHCRKEKKLTFQPTSDTTPNPHGLVQPAIPLITRLEPDKQSKSILLRRHLVALHGIQQPQQDISRSRPPSFSAHHDVRRRRLVCRGEEVSCVYKGRFVCRQELSILSTGLIVQYLPREHEFSSAFFFFSK